MNTLAKHIRAYPHARSTTLANLIAFEKTTEQLRKEVAAKKQRSFLSRLIRWWR